MTRARPFEVSEALYPFEDHYLERDGGALHYVDHGRGQTPVVMLHGNPTWSFLYRDVIGALGPEVRCLAPDYPGFGFSEAPPGYGFTPPEHAAWIEAWLEALDLPPLVLVVQDWGGPIGLSYALRHPERIAGLVVMNTWAWPTDLAGALFSAVMGGPLGKHLCLRHNFFADRIVRDGVHRAAEKPEEVFRAYTDPFPTPARRLPTYVFPRAIRREARWLAELERGLEAVRSKPAELVFGMRDRAFGSERYIARWLLHLPSARVTRLPEASHYLQEDEPEEIAAAIRRVLRAARRP